MDALPIDLSSGIPCMAPENAAELKSSVALFSPLSPQQVEQRLEDLSSEMDRSTEQFASLAGQFAEERSQHRLDVAEINGRLSMVETTMADVPRQLRDEMSQQQQAMLERLADLEGRVAAAIKGAGDGAAGSGSDANAADAERRVVELAVAEARAAVQSASEWWHQEVQRLDSALSKSAQRLDVLDSQHVSNQSNGCANDATVNRLSEWTLSLDEHLNILCKAVAESKVDLVNTGNSLTRDVTEMREESQRVQQTLQVVQAQMDAVVSRSDKEERRNIDLGERLDGMQEVQTELRKQMEELWQGLEVECQERREKAKSMATKMEAGLQSLLEKLGNSTDRGDVDDMLPTSVDADTTFGAHNAAPLSTADSDRAAVSNSGLPLGTPPLLAPSSPPAPVASHASDPILGSRGPLQLQAACAGSSALPPNGSLLASPCSSPPVAWPRQLGPVISSNTPLPPQAAASLPAGGASTQTVYRSSSPTRTTSGPASLFASGTIPPRVACTSGADVSGLRSTGGGASEGQPTAATPAVSYRAASPTREHRALRSGSSGGGGAEAAPILASPAGAYRAVSPARQTQGHAGLPVALVGSVPAASNAGTAAAQAAAEGPVPLRSPPMAYRAVSPSRSTLGYREPSPGRKLVPSPQAAPLNMPQPFPLRVLTPSGVMPSSVMMGPPAAASPPAAARRCPSPPSRPEALAVACTVQPPSEPMNIMERPPAATAGTGTPVQRMPVPIPVVSNSETTPPSTVVGDMLSERGSLDERDQYMTEIRKLRDTTERLRAEIGVRDHLLSSHVQHKAPSSVEMPPQMQRAPPSLGGGNLTVGVPVNAVRSPMPAGLAAVQ